MFEPIKESDYKKLLPDVAGRAFLFFGEEDYLKSHAVKATRERLCPEEAFAVFNDVTLDALDFTPDRLLDAMTPPPMMADTKLIVVRGLDFNTMRATELEGLCEVLGLLSEYDYNTVILHVGAEMLDEGTPKKRSATFKRLSLVATPVEFSSPTEGRLAVWASKHFESHGVRAEGADCAFLVSFVGKNMHRLASEIEKIAYYVLSQGRTAVTRQDITFVAVPELSADAFALSNAILAGRGADALSALSVMKFERTEPAIVMGMLSATLCDMQAVKTYLSAGKSVKEIALLMGKWHEYRAGLYVKAVNNISPQRLAHVLELCTKADAAVKLSYADYSPIEQLICSL